MDTGLGTEQNAEERFLEVFFYGLYMDPKLLATKGVVPRNPRKALVADYSLRVGKAATLLRQKGGTASGMAYSMTHKEIESLYRGAGLANYAPEALLAVLETGERIPVLCFNLLIPPQAEESNEEYRSKLTVVKRDLGLNIG